MGKICNAPQKHDHHEMVDDLQIRPLNDTDPPIMAAAFSSKSTLATKAGPLILLKA
jgi:hypothetical protein